MDWLKVALALYMLLVVVGAAANVALIGQERRPTTPGQAGCGLLFVHIPLFIMLLLVCQRL